MPHATAPLSLKLCTSKTMNDDQKIKIAELKQLRAIEHFKSVISMAELALKSAILINGGASVALLTFIGNIKSGDKNFLVYSLCSFAFGVLFGAIGTFLAYLAQNHFMEQINAQIKSQDDEKHKFVAIGSCGLSYLAFFIGIILASNGLMGIST
ncbi:hypothetical protein [Alteromonas sp. 4B03]|uniref:hypothetical protein n=2 Tax=unclassified Alteromonas TaxID=2614992 RepID=UPI003D27945B